MFKILFRFFGLVGAPKKKSSTTTAPNPSLLLQQQGLSSLQQQSGLGRRRGSDRSLSGSVHELAISGVKDVASRVSHSHSQSNLSDIPYRYALLTFSNNDYRGNNPFFNSQISCHFMFFGM